MCQGHEGQSPGLYLARHAAAMAVDYLNPNVFVSLHWICFLRRANHTFILLMTSSLRVFPRLIIGRKIIVKSIGMERL